MAIDEIFDELPEEKEELGSNTYHANGYDYVTDDLGRITHASGELRLEQGERDPRAQLLAGGEARLEMDDGGHLIGTRFGGVGGLENLVTEDRFVNRGAFKSVENEWADALETGGDVTMDIMPYYSDDSQRPSALMANYTISQEGQADSTDYFSITNMDMRGDEFSLDEFNISDEGQGK